MGQRTKTQQANYELFSQLSYEDLDNFIKGKQAELAFGSVSQSDSLTLKRELKSAKIVRKEKRILRK